MGHLVIRILEGSDKERWKADLWDEFLGAAGTDPIVKPGKEYSRQQLERKPDGDPEELTLQRILENLRTEDQPSKIFALVGMRLFEMLQEMGVAEEWVARRGAGVRTYFLLPDALAAWPWELLSEDLGGGLTNPYFDKPDRPATRLYRRTQASLQWTDSIVRILLVSGQPELETDKPAADHLRDIRSIFHGSGLSVMVQLCENPTNQVQLTAAIQAFSPHVIHFIGHGEKPGADYCLRFEGGNTWWWSANEIRAFFSQESWKPRLVVLNACHSSEFDVDAAPVATGLLQAGVPAVIGAAALFRIDYAREFARYFYSELAKRAAVDVALTEARRTLMKMGGFAGIDRRHWALPILTVSAPPEQILQFKPADPRVKTCPIVKKLYRRAGAFVDRVSDRASMLSFLHPADGTGGVRGIILHGQVPAGKSWLVLRSVRDFLDAGYIVRYANLTGEGAGRTSIDVLADWRGKASPASLALGPVPGGHFDSFDAAYEVASREPAPANIRAVFDTFRQGLQTARGGHRVLLIINEFRNDDSGKGVPAPDFRQGLMEQLLLPIHDAESGFDGVYTLLVARRYTGKEAGEVMDEDEFGLARLDKFKRYPIDDLPRDLDNLFDEFSDFKTDEVADGFRRVFVAKTRAKQRYKVLEEMAPWVESV